MSEQDFEPFVSRKEAATKISAMGLRVTPQTLATWAARDCGPPFKRFGNRTVYRMSEVIAWATGRLKDPMRISRERQSSESEAA